MKTAYTPDNTRSSIVILLSIAVIVTVVAALIGLSDKPDVSTIVIAPAGEAPIASQSAFGFGADSADTTDSDDSTDSAAAMAESTNAAAADVLLDETGQPFNDAQAEAPAAVDDTDAADAADDTAAQPGRQPEGTVIVVPTSEPTPTPEVAAAVEPTPVPDESEDGGATPGSVAIVPSLPASAGMVEGTFFTKGDENDGATVAQNLISLSFAEDGSGAFQGVLDITYRDGTHILLNMSGELTWAPTNPQVEAILTGAFTLDAPIAADSVTADDAELTISSLSAGSGSLCTTKCFGFTFPPQ